MAPNGWLCLTCLDVLTGAVEIFDTYTKCSDVVESIDGTYWHIGNCHCRAMLRRRLVAAIGCRCRAKV